VGEFRNGLKHGKGRWKSGAGVPNVNQYEGDYLNDKKHGFGIFSWASGNIYKGEYFEDERHGFGEMVWTDGTKYIGEWCHGIQHGKGSMILENGIIKEGYFDCNVYKGPNIDLPKTSSSRSYIS